MALASALDSYLGWERPQHHAGCKRPSWDIGVRTEERELRYHGYGEAPLKHKCQDDEFCAHGNTFDKTVVRLVCKSCGAAQLITGEKTEDTGISTTSTKWLGYGLTPRRQAGLLLWPGQPWLDYGRHNSDEPHDFVLTRTGVKEVTEETIVGQLSQSRGQRRGIVWAALAVPDPKGQFGYPQRIKFAHCNDGHHQGGSPLRTVGAAARWVAARLAEQQTQGGAA